MAGQEVQKSSSTESRFFYGYIVVATALFIMVTTFGARLSFGVFFKPILTEFGWTRAMTSGAYSLSMIVTGLLGIVMGGLNDRLGPRVVLTLCGLFLGLGYLLMSQVSAVWHLYLFFGVIIGVGQSGSWVPLMSTVARWFVARRSMMSGIVLAGTGIGGLIAPPVANWLIYIYDWHTSYMIMGSVLLVFVVLAAQLLRRDPSHKGQMPYGGDKEVKQQLKSQAKGLSLREAVYTRQFWMYFAAMFCFGFPFIAIAVHIVPHATDLGISANNAASILATMGGLSIAGRLLLGSAADRIGNRQALIIGFILMSAALFWLIPAREAWALYLFAAVFGFAQGGMGPSQSPLVATLFGLRSHGLILGVTDLGFLTGSAIGPLLAGYIFDVTDSYQLAFFICAAVSIAGIIMLAPLKPIKGENYQNEAHSDI